MAIQKKVKKLCATTTEPLEHIFGTTRSCKREFTVNEFIIFSNELEIILNNVIEKGNHTGTFSKGYTSGFTGYPEVITKMRSKLKRGAFVSEEILVAVDVQGPILRLMQTFGINKASEYCNPVNTILGICRIYRSYIKEINSVHLPPSYRSPEKHINKQETIERLANIEMDFNAMSLDSENENKNN